MASVIPSKDKSLHSQQSSLSSTQGQTTTLSSHHSQISSYHEKSVNSSTLPQPSSSSSQSLQDPFTDLFGTPIKTRPSPDSLNFKSKDNGGNGSGTSKSSLSSHKSSTKKISPSDNIKSSSDLIIKSSEKEKKLKPINGTIISSKEIKTEKDAKPIKDKSFKKRDESPKVKKDKLSKSSFDGRPTTPNLSATSSNKKSSSLNNTTSIKKETIDNLNVGGSGGIKDSSKKRKRSLSPPSFPPSTDNTDKKETESLIKSSSKDGLSEKSHKEKSKKQKVSSRDQVSSSATTGSNSNHKVKDVKKELSTSTTISLTNNENTGTTTLEIKSVKKEKTWDSEMKKSRSKEHKSDEVKSSRENVSKDVNKVQVRDKEMLKEKEKEQPVLEKKDKEKSKEKSSKNRDKDRDRDQKDKEKEKKRNKEKDAIHDDLFSSKEPVISKYAKIPKEKYLGANLNVNSNNHLSGHVNSLRETSSSPASIVSGSLTPGGGAFIGAPSSVSSLNGPITTLMAEMDQESLPVSPLSSSCDPHSPLTFGSKDKITSSDDENSNPPIDHRSTNHSRDSNGSKNNSINNNNNNSLNINKCSSIHGNNNKRKQDNTVRDEPPPPMRNIHSMERNKNIRENPSSGNNNSGNKKRKEIDSSHHAKQMDPMDDPMENQVSPRQANNNSRSQPSSYDYDYISQLKILHRKINDLRDRDVLQRIVDIIEETGLFNMTNAAFDFDLMQLDRNTVRKIRQCLIST
ncbi:myb-like protein X isoform X3 [Panonychus citri]|nr:myb-like protein X isoform X3 [Panonychus citri]